MDTMWSYSDLLDVLHGHPGILCLICSGLSGLAAICIVLDCARRLIKAGQCSEAGLSMAEGFWVTGNVMWMLNDSVTHWQWMFDAAITLFSSGCIVVLTSMVCKDDNAEDTSVEDGSFMQATSAAHNEISVVTETLATVVATVPEATKKRPRAWRSRKVPRLMKRVTVLPKGLSSKMPNFTQKVARLALNSYGDPKASIALLDLGQVRKQHSEWEKLLPRVRPHYSVHSRADKKVVQLLSQRGCAFTCVTAEEVNMVLSLGASPEDVFFCEACKLKTHLTFVKEKGVRLMPFDGAAELHKIAAEFPAARLLLQMAPPKDVSPSRSSPVGFGVSRTEWASLLELATELGLEVVGASLRVCPGCEEWGSLGASLSDARDFFTLATQSGHTMEILDLGVVDVSNSSMFGDVAGTIQEQLAQWFPFEEFLTLRVVASPGKLFTRNASMLLTQVIKKQIGPQPSDVELEAEPQPDSPAIRYVINAGVYGAFANILTDRVEPASPAVVSFGFADRPMRRCRFLGPVQDQLDVVLKDAIVPELEEGEWLLWPRICARASSKRSAAGCVDDAGDESHTQSQVWYYAEDGSVEDAGDC